MSDLSDTIKGFYSDFILRDLLSFVIPGAIVIGTLALAFLKIDVSTIWGQIYIVRILSQISIISWILLFGLFYMSGLGIQYVIHKIIVKNLKFDTKHTAKEFNNPCFGKTQ
jgi:hypothetical protein